MTSLRFQILAEGVSFQMRYCLLSWDDLQPVKKDGSFRIQDWLLTCDAPDKSCENADLKIFQKKSFEPVV